MNEKLLAAIRSILGLTDNAAVTNEDAAAFLKKHAADVYQVVFDEGHGVALAQQQQKITRLESSIQALTGDRDRIKQELADLRKQSPDVEKVRTELQAQVEAKDAEIEKLKGEHTTEKRNWTVDSTLERIRSKLAPQVVDGYEEVLVDRSSTRKLLSFDDEGNFRILRPGKTTAFAGDLDAQVEALAAELMKEVKPVFKNTKVKKGSGQEGEAGAGGGNGAALFDRVREEAKKETGGPAINPEQELNKRLGLGANT